MNNRISESSDKSSNKRERKTSGMIPSCVLSQLSVSDETVAMKLNLHLCDFKDLSLVLSFIYSIIFSIFGEMASVRLTIFRSISRSIYRMIYRLKSDYFVELIFFRINEMSLEIPFSELFCFEKSRKYLEMPKISSSSNQKKSRGCIGTFMHLTPEEAEDELEITLAYLRSFKNKNI